MNTKARTYMCLAETLDTESAKQALFRCLSLLKDSQIQKPLLPHMFNAEDASELNRMMHDMLFKGEVKGSYSNSREFSIDAIDGRGELSYQYLSASK